MALGSLKCLMSGAQKLKTPQPHAPRRQSALLSCRQLLSRFACKNPSSNAAHNTDSHCKVSGETVTQGAHASRRRQAELLQCSRRQPTPEARSRCHPAAVLDAQELRNKAGPISFRPCRMNDNLSFGWRECTKFDAGMVTFARISRNKGSARRRLAGSVTVIPTLRFRILNLLRY